MMGGVVPCSAREESRIKAESGRDGPRHQPRHPFAFHSIPSQIRIHHDEDRRLPFVVVVGIRLLGAVG